MNEHRGTPAAGFRESPDLLARIREGISEADLLLVVDTQAPKLLRFEGGKYFRPATLFGPKNFRRYLDEARAGPPDEDAFSAHEPEWKRRGYANELEFEAALQRQAAREQR